MYGRNDLAVLAFCLTLLVPGQLRARDDGRFADSPLKPWFDHLASGKGLCCCLIPQLVRNKFVASCRAPALNICKPRCPI